MRLVYHRKKGERLKPRLTASPLAILATLALLGPATGCGEDESANTGAAEGAPSGSEQRSEPRDGGQPAAGATDGSSSNGAQIRTSALAKDEFLERAEAACNRAKGGLLQKSGQYMEKHSSAGKPEAEVTAGMIQAVLLPSIEKEIAAIRRLGAPEGDEETIEAALVAEEEAIEKVRRLDSVRSNEDFEKPFADSSRQLRDYGFESCTHG